MRTIKEIQNAVENMQQEDANNPSFKKVYMVEEYEKITDSERKAIDESNEPVFVITFG